MTCKIKWLILFVMLFPNAVAQATPSKAIWQRVIFIGANENFYCTFFIERDQPGSYYSYVDRVYLCKYVLKDNRLAEKLLLRTIHHDDTTTLSTWRHRDTIPDSSNAEKYLIENQIYFSFPSSDLDEYGVFANGKGIFLKKEGRLARILSGKVIEGLAPGYTMDLEGFGHTKLINYYEGPQHFFFLVQYGEGNYDSFFSQAVIPVLKATIEKARKVIEEKGRGHPPLRKP